MKSKVSSIEISFIFLSYFCHIQSLLNLQVKSIGVSCGRYTNDRRMLTSFSQREDHRKEGW
jgi:hypothetical protein